VSTLCRSVQLTGLKAETGLSLEVDDRRIQKPMAETPAGGTTSIER
jgi:hypothetical protein